MIRKQDALEYHRQGRSGKIEIALTKPCATQRDLSLAYTPGVAEPCREIAERPQDAYAYTAKGNLVAVVSNGTAVLGLGDIGPLAGKPVMEGKGLLFKRFADIDVFDIEIDAKDPEEVIRIVRALEPTFGGINLEDIKAPECFRIEEELKATMSIPVFHDDQHGTAIISGAGLVNALEIVGKRIEEVKVVFSGAGAAGIACARFYLMLGVKKENLLLVDTKGVVYRGRKEGMNPYKEFFAAETEARTLQDAMRGADVFAGVSVGGLVTPAMVASMAADPILFAMANPDPEILPEDALAVRRDLVMATGRSDYPNQVNNVLGFPFIFRGALDVMATCINDEMKLAAARALADLAKEDVPDSVIKAYGGKLRFGRDYIIPKPLDPRVLLWEAPAVARAAMESGVARRPIADLDAYRDALESRFGRGKEIMRGIIHKAQRAAKRIVFPEGAEEKVLRASQIVLDEKIAVPVLLGSRETILAGARALDLELQGVEIIEPLHSEKLEAYADVLYDLRRRKGVTRDEARIQMRAPVTYGMTMVQTGDADGIVAGLTQSYPATIRPALQILRPLPGVRTIAGLYMLVLKNDVRFLTDATVNFDPTAEELAEIAVLAASKVRSFDIEPRVAMLSFSNFGSTQHPSAAKMAEAAELVKRLAPDLMVDGEMMADTAVSPEILETLYPFSSLKGGANLLVCPNLESANIAVKLLAKLGGAEVYGPLLLGMRKPVYLLIPGSEVADIVNVTAMAARDAQETGAGVPGRLRELVSAD
ncbi:MAG TPA: NADP-dependent malic enzyme [Candidatus Polarisedimenticolaceae bacterium]|nr:NADP-dependent malic enzyme [Candidatus Polarisedimenticolaceae bacterium]